MANSKSNYPAAQVGDLEPDFVAEAIWCSWLYVFAM